MPGVFQFGAAMRWLEKEFGGALQELETFPATAAAVATVVGNNPDAVLLLFINTGAFDIFLKLRQDIPAATGIRLGANGGGTSLSVREDGTLPTREWFASSPGGASSLYILRLQLFSADAQGQSGGAP
jgi:hypothetical protein